MATVKFCHTSLTTLEVFNATDVQGRLHHVGQVGHGPTNLFSSVKPHTNELYNNTDCIKVAMQIKNKYQLFDYPKLNS